MSTKSKSVFITSIFPVLCALAGAAVTAIFGWLGNYQQANISYKNACIIRIDHQEEKLREKYSTFLKAWIYFSYSPDMRHRNNEILRNLAQPLASAAIDMAAYAPDKLSNLSYDIGAALNSSINSNDDVEIQEKSIREAISLTGKANSAFRNALKELDTKRGQCG